MTLAITKAMVVDFIVDAVKKDQANRYILLKDWTLPRLNHRVPDYQGDNIVVKDGTITVKAYVGNVCNGCSLSPDEIGNWKPVIGAIFHDPWYGEIADIASTWRWPESSVRKLGDEIFACILAATGTPIWLARLYLTGVRAFGWLARIARVVILVSAGTAIITGTGCGCQMPNQFDQAPIDPPYYQETTNAPGQ